MPIALLLQIVQLIAGAAGAVSTGQKIIEAWHKDHPDAKLTQAHVDELKAVDPATAAIAQACLNHPAFTVPTPQQAHEQEWHPVI